MEYYLIGMVITWLAATSWWIFYFGDGVFEGGMWGMLVSLLWPLVWVALIFGLVAKGIVVSARLLTKYALDKSQHRF